jgi:hypothetical protein
MNGDIVIGVLFAALVIGMSALAGRMLDRTRACDRARDDDARLDLYGDF